MARSPGARDGGAERARHQMNGGLPRGRVTVSNLWIADEVVNLFISQLVKSDSPTPTWREVMAKKAKKAAKAKKAKKTRAKK